MNPLEALRIALGSLAVNRLRSLLATLGIMIGITAVSTLLSAGQSFQRFVNQQFASLETNALTLMAQPDFGGMGIPANEARLTDADLAAIADLPGVSEVVARYIQSGEVRAGPMVAYAEVIGVRPNALRPGKPLVMGRFISAEDIEARARVAVLSWSLAQNTFPDGRPLGRELIIQGLSFTVVGVSMPEENFFRSSDIASVPISTARDRLFPISPASRIEVSEATIYIEDLSRIDAIQAAITELLRGRHRLTPEQGNDFMFQNFREFAEANTNILVGITAFLGVIGGISLLVGGIGIMNIMLVSVAERTQEIGLRKALGARRTDIMAQFLVEAVALSLIGGIGGVLLTWALVQSGAIAVQLLLPDAGLANFIVIDLTAMLLALGFASFVGVVAGLYPALRAGRLSPIEALRTN